MNTFGSEKEFGKFQRTSPYGHDGSKATRLPFQPASEFVHDSLTRTAVESNPARDSIDIYKSLAL